MHVNCMCQMDAMFSMKLLMLNFVMPIVIVCTAGLECDGTKKSERITRTPLKSVYVLPGNQANLVWTWCIAVNSSVTGIIVFRSSPRDPKQMNIVLTMDLSKNVYYKKDKSRYELDSILNKTNFQEKTVFIINNVSKADGGAYSLHVRREGIRDLQSEVNVIVKTATDPTKEPRLTIPTSGGITINYTILETGKRKVESVVHSRPSYVVILVIVFSVLTLFVAFVVGAALLIRRKKSGDGAWLVHINSNFGSGEPILETHS